MDRVGCFGGYFALRIKRGERVEYYDGLMSRIIQLI